MPTKVKNLVVFQRTANWIMPRPDRNIEEAEKALNRKTPLNMKMNRLGVYWFNELTAPFLILKYDMFKAQPSKRWRNFFCFKVMCSDRSEEDFSSIASRRITSRIVVRRELFCKVREC
ncbi:hypothetical protein [Mycobacterium tuberculosis]|uniref:hypothetical protein n=1 Tax=Mycobacterium tuberculosis TaxID=1773 RepID=UPI00272C3191|nr:hypothetical protein [Mycobacterium tuberculosis]